jgi:hypothetical protein
MHDELERVEKEAVVVYWRLHYRVWFWRLRKITMNLREAYLKYTLCKFDVRVTVHRRYYIRRNQLDATKCWFIDSTCFEHYYAHLQEHISEYRFLVSKPVSRLGCVAQSC